MDQSRRLSRGEIPCCSLIVLCILCFLPVSIRSQKTCAKNDKFPVISLVFCKICKFWAEFEGLGAFFLKVLVYVPVRGKKPPRHAVRVGKSSLTVCDLLSLLLLSHS